VAVHVGNSTVGHLHHTGALEFLTALREGGFDRGACGAMIVVRPDPRLDDHAFRVRLDAVSPFRLAEPADQPAKDRRRADRAA
jgi:hypothetical protein